GARPAGRANVVPASQRQALEIHLGQPLRIDTLRYELPPFIDETKPQWHLRPAPYAHYVVEGSIDGVTWTVLADRTHGPWRGAKTDTFPSMEMRHLRFRGSFSNGQPFVVRNVAAFGPRR
ncbi:MAG: hypothetical protein JNL62_19180, partial [Bryobacterales bacterium]|nr:hypothetical protein [Bryobacterales bacterium]